MARAAVALAAMRADLPAFADIPFAGPALSINEVQAGLAALIGRNLKITRFSWLLMRVLSPFWELARELMEMRYLFDTAHALDPAPLATLLPDFRMTPVADILRAHLAVRAK